MELRIPIEKKDLKRYCFEQDIFGKFIYIGCTSLSLVQWHPFDVASTIEDGYISVFISVSSGWTQKLSQKIFGSSKAQQAQQAKKISYPPSQDYLGNKTVFANSDASESNLSSNGGIKICESQVSGFTDVSEIQVEFLTNDEVARKGGQNAFVSYESGDLIISGLQDSMPKYVIENEVAILVCGGTGIAPMISIIKYFIRNIGNKKKIENLKNIYLVWSIKKYYYLGLLEELLAEIISRDLQSLVKIFVHYTGDYSLTSAQLVPQNFFNRLPNISSQFVRIIPGRNDVYSLLEAATTENPGCTYGLTAVGPNLLVRNARRTTTAWNRSSPFMLKVNYYEG
ncbi:hypothetical protein BB561_003600 [Smittium simulii]|uniref:FAD-binding FR-type domain-containing protein n=1 Tax=Smittium simulii TaxID=133385 RepID=A0A2T9YKH4_9FUNG|nr:hypothetical protein BB561_003600 [Smittium simulii]